MALVNDIVTRFYLNGDWRDISTEVRAARGIYFTRGRQDEDDTTPPQRCSFDLDNRSGTWSDRNPLGTYYGHLRRNTPMEMSLRVVKDTATATASNGWGSTDTATGDATGAWQVESWTVDGTASNYAKAAGKATHATAAGGQARASYLSNFRGRDLDVRFTVALSVTNVTGTNGISIGNVMLRGQGALTAWYMLRLVVQTDETLTIDWWAGQTGDSLTAGPDTVAGITHVNTNVYRVRAQVEGRALRAKVWLNGTAEPYGWTKVAVDAADIAATDTLRDAQGWVGVRSSMLSGNTNTNITVSYDDFEVLVPVFAGEIAEWSHERDVTGDERVVSIVAEGPRRRFAQGNSLARSALYNFTTNAGTTLYKDPFVYWPLEGGEMTNLDTVDTMGTSSRLSFNQPNAGSTVGKIKWGADTSRPGSYRSPTITGGGTLSATLEPATEETAWAVQWQQRFNFREGTTTTFQAGDIFVIPDMLPGSLDLNVGLQSDTIVNFTMLSHTFDSAEDVDSWHTIAISAEQSGADVNFTMLIDGVHFSLWTEIGLALVGLNYVFFATLPDSTDDMSIGHITIYSGDLSSWNFYSVNGAALGYSGDTGLVRVQQLALEYSFGSAWFANDTLALEGTTMGPQRVVALTSILDDCELMDGGLLYEQRSTIGFQFRGLVSMLSRSPWVTLDMGTSKHLSPPLKATTDDRNITNSVTARRADGGEYTYTLTDGPLASTPAVDGGIGEYSRSITFNAELETDLPNLASWAVAKGTIDQERYSEIKVELHRLAVLNTSGLVSKLRELDVGELIRLDGLESNYIYDDPDEIVLGINGYLDKFRHTLILNTVPGEVYRTLVIGSTAGASSEFSRLDSGSTTIDEDLDTTETGVTVEVEVGSAFWVDSTNYATHFPFDVVVGGEQMTVTACTTPSGQNQTFTVTRNVNSLPGGKAHSAGAEISLYRPNYYGL